MENEMWQKKTFKWVVQSINFHLPSWLLKKLRFCFWNFFTISLPDGFFICFVVGVQSLSCVGLFVTPWKARLPCPPPSPRVCSNSRPLSYLKKFPKVLRAHNSKNYWSQMNLGSMNPFRSHEKFPWVSILNISALTGCSKAIQTNKVPGMLPKEDYSRQSYSNF